MNDIFASDRLSQQERLVTFIQSVERAVKEQTMWIGCFTHPHLQTSTRIEIREDLLHDWSATRYSPTRMSRKTFSTLQGACALVMRWSDMLERQGMLKTIQSEGALLRDSNLRNRLEFRDGEVEPEWIQSLIGAFTLHNDWVDLATCLSMSADEYVDANWRRFRDWLAKARQTNHTDREVYAFGMAVWHAYRQDVLI